MAACPICQTELEITSQHYGTLFTCPHCSGVFFVDWGGQPEAAATEERSAAEEAPAFADIPEAVPYEIPAADFSPAPHFEMPSGPLEPAPEEGVPSESEPVPPETSEETSENYDFAEPLGMEEPMVAAPLDTPDLSDIANFGNNDLEQSAFSYTMTISGIDSSGIRAQVEEAVSDSRFGWNVLQIMSQIKGGVLTIKSMNAVKASILMQRLKYLPVQVRWRQDVLSNPL